MLSKISIAWRIGFALVWMALCHLYMALVFSDWVTFTAAVCGAFAAICLGHFGKAVMKIYEAFRALWQSPETPEYQHTVDGVREAARNIHNWASRNVAAAIGICGLLAVYFTHSLIVVGLFAVAIVASTHWPAIARRFRDWGAKLEAAE